MTLDIGLTRGIDGRAMSVADSLCYACFTHVPLLVEYPPFVKTIYLGEAQAEGRLNLRDLAPRWAQYHGMIGGSTGSFALRNYILANQPEARQVGICQYRKFLARYPVGQPGAPSRAIMDVITPQSVTQDLLADSMLPGDHEFLLVRPSHLMVHGIVEPYLGQYVYAHQVEDFLRFVAMAVDLGVLDKHDVVPLFDERVFFIGGMELGVFPADLWLPTIGAIEEVTWACVQHHGTRRGGDQARLWGFCMERLGSYLLVKRLRALGGPALSGNFFGHLTLITEDGTYVPGI
jgi:hypothetical protein